MHVDVATWHPRHGWEPALPRPDHRPTVVVVTGAASDPDAQATATAITELARAWSGHPVLAGAPAHPGAVCAPLAVAVLRFDRTEVCHADVDVDAAGGARRAGRRLAASVGRPGLGLVLLVADASDVNGSALTSGVADVAPGVAVAGGVGAVPWAGPGCVPGRSGGRRASAIGLVGDRLRVGLAAACGWRPHGIERLVTRAHGDVVHVVTVAGDGRETPGAALVGEGAEALGAPVAVRELDGRVVLRSPRLADRVRGTVTFDGDVPQGAVLRRTGATPDDLVAASRDAAAAATTGEESIALVTVAPQRARLLGARAGDELRAIGAQLAPGAALVSLGAAAPVATLAGRPDVHAASAVVVTVGEADAQVP